MKQNKLQRVSFKSDFDIALRSIENDLSARYDKLLDEKNDELTKQLEKSIDLMDENEMIENELDTLHIQLEEKNYLLKSLKENELIYQNEITSLKMQLSQLPAFNACDVIGFQFKINNTRDESTMCNLHADQVNNINKSKTSPNEPFANSKSEQILKKIIVFRY